MLIVSPPIRFSFPVKSSLYPSKLNSYLVISPLIDGGTIFSVVNGMPFLLRDGIL